MDLATRTVEIAGLTAEPCGAWTAQMARNLTDALDGFLTGARYLLCDRDPLYTNEFREILRGAGIKTVRLPPRSPDLNAHAERFVRSIKEECLARMIILGEQHLRHAIEEYVAHYHGERNHQGLDNRLILDRRCAQTRQNAVACRERLGGLLKYYHHGEAA